MRHFLEKCLEALKKTKAEALLVSSKENIKYLLQIEDIPGYLLVFRELEPVYLTYPLFYPQIKKYNLKVILCEGIDIFKEMRIYLEQKGIKKLGFEPKNLSFLEYERLKKELQTSSLEVFSLSDFIENLRMIKTAQEISMIKKAIAISNEAFNYISEIYNPQMTEKYLSIEIERFLKLKGDNDIAFPAIVAKMQNSCVPHHRPLETRIDSKSLLVDLGAKYSGYCADLTKIFIKGKINSFMRRIYEVLKRAQDLSITKIKEGIRVKQIDRLARGFIEKKGWGRHFIHGLGHGIGLMVHEAPFINPYNETILKEGMVFTIEPAIYLEDKFGIRIEDIVLVRANKAEVLSERKHIYYL